MDTEGACAGDFGVVRRQGEVSFVWNTVSFCICVPLAPAVGSTACYSWKGQRPVRPVSGGRQDDFGIRETEECADGEQARSGMLVQRVTCNLPFAHLGPAGGQLRLWAESV